MTGRGDFTAHRRDGDYVIKVLDGQHPAATRFVAAAQRVGMTGMHTYLSTLRAAGVALPPDLSVVSSRPLAVRHRWLRGPGLLNCASADPRRFVDASVEIALWVRTLDGTDARMDTNLANFCLDDDRVVLVDVLPPLVPSTRPEPSDLFEVLFAALCFDTSVTLDALIGYAARALLHAPKNVAARQLDDLACQLPPEAVKPSEARFPASWFRARVVLALRALAGQVAPGAAHEFFAQTSVRAFRDLPETHRAAHIRQVEQNVKELALT